MSPLRTLSTILAALCVAGCGPTPVIGELPAQPSAPSLPRRWVFSAGVSNYEDKHLNLHYADADAEEIYKLFAGPDGGRVPEGQRKLLTNDEANRDNLLAELSRMMERTEEDDLVIIFLSMHGVRGPDKASFFLLAHDTKPGEIISKGILDANLRGAIALARARRIVLLLDTCHAGAFALGKGFRWGVGAATAVGTLPAEGEGLLSSSWASEVSREDPTLGHGLFTYYLLEGLRGAADGAGGDAKDGLVTLGELFEYTYDRMKERKGPRQHPDFQGEHTLPLVAHPVQTVVSDDPIVQLKRISDRIEEESDAVFRPIVSADATLDCLPQALKGIKNFDRAKLGAQAQKIIDGGEADVGTLGLDADATRKVTECFGELKALVEAVQGLDSNVDRLRHMLKSAPSKTDTLYSKAVARLRVKLNSPSGVSDADRAKAASDLRTLQGLVDGFHAKANTWGLDIVGLQAKAQAKVKDLPSKFIKLQ